MYLLGNFISDFLVAIRITLAYRCILLLEDLDAAFTRSVSRDDKSTGVPTVPTADAAKTENNDGSTLSLSGLLNSLDGVAAAEGRYVCRLLFAYFLMSIPRRLLFATTNHIERLDPALSRPGRMDVWINFTHATKWQAEGIFKCFFPHAPSTSDDTSSSSEPSPEPTPEPSTEPSTESTPSSSDDDASQKNLPLPKRKSTHAVPLLSEQEISELAKRFAEAIPEDELSVASLQGYLLKNKTRPRQCVEEVAKWVIDERETREKLKKERAEVRI